MKFLGTSLLVLLLTATFGSAQAACGGGGWHSSRSSATTTTYDSQPIVSSSEASHVVSTSVQPTRDTSYSRPAPNPGTFDTARLDNIAPRLNLSQKQWDRIQTAKQQVREDQLDLNRDVNKAEQRLAQCSGNCDTERLQLNKASQAQRSFSADAEFDRRLQSILSSEQMSIYRGSDRAR
jgi:hypothetical protein